MSALRTFASPAATPIYDALDTAGNSADLDCLARRLWKAYGEGAISEDDATFLGNCIDRQRPRGRTRRRLCGAADGRQASRLKPRGRQGLPGRKASRERRRTLGGSAVLPPQLRCNYTEGQRAVLTIVAGEVKHHGVCELPIDKIAALAGVCRSTVQTTMHEARRLGHVKITERPRWGRKSLTNMVQIISPDWLTWIARGPTAHRPIGSNSVKIVSTTKNTDIKHHGVERVARPQAGYPRGAWARPGPTQPWSRRRHGT